MWTSLCRPEMRLDGRIRTTEPKHHCCIQCFTVPLSAPHRKQQLWPTFRSCPRHLINISASPHKHPGYLICAAANLERFNTLTVLFPSYLCVNHPPSPPGLSCFSHTKAAKLHVSFLHFPSFPTTVVERIHQPLPLSICASIFLCKSSCYRQL